MQNESMSMSYDAHDVMDSCDNLTYNHLNTVTP